MDDYYDGIYVHGNINTLPEWEKGSFLAKSFNSLEEALGYWTMLGRDNTLFFAFNLEDQMNWVFQNTEASNFIKQINELLLQKHEIKT